MLQAWHRGGGPWGRCRFMDSSLTLACMQSVISLHDAADMEKSAGPGIQFKLCQQGWRSKGPSGDARHVRSRGPHRCSPCGTPPTSCVSDHGMPPELCSCPPAGCCRLRPAMQTQCPGQSVLAAVCPHSRQPLVTAPLPLARAAGRPASLPPLSRPAGCPQPAGCLLRQAGRAATLPARRVVGHWWLGTRLDQAAAERQRLLGVRRCDPQAVSSLLACRP